MTIEPGTDVVDDKTQRANNTLYSIRGCGTGFGKCDDDDHHAFENVLC